MTLSAIWEPIVSVRFRPIWLTFGPFLTAILYYLGINRSEICFTSRNGGRVLLIGGPPFPETILMWWNFVGRSPEEIAQARADWEQHHARFGEVRAYTGARLEAPALNRIAQANPIS